MSDMRPYSYDGCVCVCCLNVRALHSPRKAAPAAELRATPSTDTGAAEGLRWREEETADGFRWRYLVADTGAVEGLREALEAVYDFWKGRPDLAPGIGLRERVRAALAAHSAPRPGEGSDAGEVTREDR